jgi:hypothetical protein
MAPMGRGSNKARTAVSRRLMSEALLVALLLRALIPMGFMPDMEAARAGIFRFIDCRLHSQKSSHDVADHSAHASHHHDEADGNHHHHDHDDDNGTTNDLCPFAGFGATAPAIGVPAILVTEAEAGPVILAGPAAFNLPPFNVGTQLGSRAPPNFS